MLSTPRTDKPSHPVLQRIADLSIRTKLVSMMLLATLVSVVVGVAFVLLISRRSFEQELRASVGTAARLQANQCAVGLAFKEVGLAELETLAAPQMEEGADSPQRLAVPVVLDAVIFDADDKVFDTYTLEGKPFLPATVRHGEFQELNNGYLHHFEPIIHEEAEIGTLYLRVDASLLEARVAEHVRSLLMLMGVVLVASLALAYALQGPISKPIRGLAAVVGRVTHEGDYSVRVKKKGDDEIGQLYDGFNAMMAQIEQRQTELERSNRDLDQFAHVASHDLKAPLRAIASLSAWLDEDHGHELSDEAREKLASLRSRVARMDELIQGILRYARLGRGGSRRRPVDVCVLLHEVIDLVGVPEGCTIEIVEPMPLVVSQRLGLEQIFSNLITNAIRHHTDPERAHITISCDRIPTGFAFTVADDGPGIGSRDQSRIFHMFQTLEGTSSGTGLGLSLVKKLVEDEGGEVQVVSAAGQGSVFRFTWPQSASDDDTVSETMAAVS